MIPTNTKCKLIIVPDYGCVKYSNMGNARSGHVIIF